MAVISLKFGAETRLLKYLITCWSHAGSVILLKAENLVNC